MGHVVINWPSPRQASAQLLLIILLYNLIVLPFLFLLSLYYMLAQPGLAASELETLVLQYIQSPGGVGLGLVCQFVVIMPVVLRAAGYPGSQWREVLALKPVRLPALLLWLGLLAGYLLLQAGFNLFMQVQGGEFIENLAGTRHLGLLLGMFTLAPVLEEAIFRGYLFSAWRHSRLGLSGTLLLTSGIFALLHSVQYSPILLFQLFLQGLLFGLAREYTGSVLTPMLLHASNNLLAGVLILYFSSV